MIEQPYGIHPLADAAGLLLSAALTVGLWPRRPLYWLAWLGLSVPSALGSLWVIDQATARGDTLVTGYHVIWVVLPVFFIWRVWVALVPAAERADNEPPAPDDGGPVHDVTSLPAP